MDVIEQQGDGGSKGLASAGAAIRVLLVDDHSDTVIVMRAILEGRGFHVLSATTCAEALQQAEEGFDLLLCDIDLPDGTGIELLERLRALHPVRAIAMSGYGMPDDIERSLQAGYHRHLVKPFTAATLFDAITLAVA
jgi:CheY-like chemotaxis protein